MGSQSRAPLARLSIRVKLPLAAALLILLVGGALSTAAYFAMRRTLLDRASERLATLSSEFGGTFRASVAQAKTRALAVARKPAIRSYLRSPSPALRAAALEAMKYDGPQPELSVASELRDPTGRIVLTAQRDSASPGTALPSLGEQDASAITKALPALAGSDSAVLGRLRQAGDSILYPLVARIPGEPGGYYVNWRSVSNAPQARQQIASILGSEAEFYFGNADGSLWSDLGRPTTAPPVPAGSLNGVLRFSRPGKRGEVLAAAALIPGTPWAFTIEFPTRAILAPARGFLRMLGAIAILCMTVGFVIAWMLSDRITGPLRRLIDSADAIAAGDTSRRVELQRLDELGRLGASFDTMAAQVAESRNRLEATVSSRTSELERTLEQLQDTQESLVRREKLALLGQLASGVGHELRNPLGVMANAIYYLEAVIPDPAQEVREYLGILRQQVGLSAKIVNDLLDLTRTTPAHRQRVPLQSITDTQLKQFPLNGTRLEQEFAALLPLVYVDPVHAGQVVQNLLSNAVQAMGEVGGTLRLRGSVDVTGFVRLEVTDSGPGIAPEHLSKIFEPLFTTKARGIGLGLAVSKSLAQANGGDLTVRSEPGHGATFLFTLPAAPDAG